MSTEDHIEIIEVNMDGFKNAHAAPTPEQIAGVELAFRRVAGVFEDSRRQVEAWTAAALVQGEKK